MNEMYATLLSEKQFFGFFFFKVFENHMPKIQLDIFLTICNQPFNQNKP